MTYIHWGTDKFEKERFRPVSCNPYLNKPVGGFWCCEEQELQWNEWSIENLEIKKMNLDKCVKFTLKSDSNILLIDSLETVQKLSESYPMQARPMIMDFFLQVKETRISNFIDWKRIAKQYDAIAFQNFYRYSRECDGIDLNSVCICNPDTMIILSQGV